METRQPKILIVEDDPVLRSVGKRQLSALGFADVIVADTGEAALELVDDQRPSLILMDVGLPGIDGNQTTAAIRETEEQLHLARATIIALTANSDREKCFDAGMDDYLLKPALLADLQRILIKWLGDQAVCSS